jgi:hypothetical protein
MDSKVNLTDIPKALDPADFEEFLQLSKRARELKLKQEKIDQANRSKETKKEIELLKALKKKYPNE